MMRHLFVCSLAALCVSAFGSAVLAQSQKRRVVVPAAQPAAPAGKKKTKALRSGPSLGSERFVRRSKTERLAESKWKEAFGLLRKLIKSTPDDDAAKPDLYYRLSEMFWERASSTDIRAFAEEEKCLERGGNEQTCESARKALVALSEKYRDDAIKVYKHIVRKFPNYPRLDGVLFALAFNFQQKGKPQSAKKIYKTLIQRFPRSRHVPDTLLNFAEIYFEEGDVKVATKAYRKVVTNYKTSGVYGYALYKLGWCNFNEGKYRQALSNFVGVLKYSRAMKGKGRGSRNRLTLEREALRDVVRTYVHVGSAKPTKALRFFRKLDPDNYVELGEKLAELYADTGQFKKSSAMYRNLIKANRRSYRVVGYQRAVAENTRSLGDQVKAAREIKRIVSLWKKMRNAPDADPKRVKKDRRGMEESLRSMAVTYHRQATKTKSDNDYALAYALYKEYVDTFADAPDAYAMTFYFAELLYGLEKWKEAAERYEQAIGLKAQGEYSRDAAHGAVLAYKKLLSITPDTLNQTTSKAELEKKEIPKPKAIPEPYQKFIQACGVYETYIKGTEFEVDVRYDVARIYFDFNHFDKAISVFRDIAEKSSNHRLSIIAANLLLDTFILQKNYTALNGQAETFLKTYQQDRDPTFHARLITIKQNATFNQCKEIEGRGDNVEAARCFKKYAREFPSSEYADKALYNAAVNYQQVRQVEKSIAVLAKLVNSSSGSALIPKALYEIARNLQALAIYSKASKAYEYYAKQFPKKENALDALQNAAFFRMGLGQLDQAIANYEGYMKMVGRKDKKKASEVFFSIGKIYEKRAQWPKVVQHYRTFLKRYGKVAKVDLVLEAFTRIGNAHWEQAKPALAKTRKNWRLYDRHNKPAQKAFRAGYATFSKLSAEQKQGLTTGRAAVAEARFRMGEDVFYTVKYRTRLKAKTYRNLKRFIKTMTKKIVERGKQIGQGRVVYDEVIRMQSPKWAIAAIARQGEMLEEFSNAIYNYPAPKSFNEDQVEAFKGTMTDKAEVQRQQAINTYVLCLKKAQELRWFNEWSDNAERRLAQLDPGKFRYNAEIRAKPINFGTPTVRQDLIAKLPEEGE
ncbi:MAG: tetratricopeptide repeat protein [Myxococcota bacterium]|nr:tetratricopeptide repeat protein [Myxococcota bacterium]